MPTLNQLKRDRLGSCRRRKKHFLRSRLLNKCPQRKVVCLRVYITKPKKPNSSNRKIAKIFIEYRRLKPKNALVAIPGQGHTLQKHSQVLLRGGRVRDLPGVHYKMIRGKYDFTSVESFIRTQRRSKYGLKRLDKKT
jgi:small subunit ribosomal protein S12